MAHALEKADHGTACTHEMLGLTRDFKLAVVSMVRELKKTMVKWGKEGRYSNTHQIENVIQR